MKILTSYVMCMVVLSSACSLGHANVAKNPLTVGGKKLAMQSPLKCAAGSRPAPELARYLSQYNPAQDPKSDISDETPWTAKEIRLIKDGLVEHGFRYPNGEKSVMTWMDFDGDGACDFTASAGMGGARSTDRMFLFKGLPKGEFRLVDAYLSYMDGNTVLVPYIPLTVSDEKLPVLVSKETLMQWQTERKQFATCDSIAIGPQAEAHRRAAPVLAALCPQQQQIYTWFADQLPRKNVAPHAPVID